MLRAHLTWGTLASGMLGAFMGSACALVLVFGTIEPGGVAIGSWRTNIHIGSSEASPWLRALIARRGLFALSRNEALYFTSTTDSEGQSLREGCEYQIDFSEPPAAWWWSLTLYAEDDFLAANGDDAASVSADGWSQDQTVFRAVVSDTPGKLPWLSSVNSGAFSLTLRLYRPDRQLVSDPGSATLPHIERGTCKASS